MAARSPITCHVLDSSVGRPAQGVKVTLHLLHLFADDAEDSSGGIPKAMSSGTTDVDGRVTNLLDPSTRLPAGTYKMTFITEPYFEATGTRTFYPFVEITFSYTDPAQHYHIPLLISPFSYTTYRGS